MFGECVNRTISRDLSSANSISHPLPNFQCWLVQSDSKSEADIAYAKLKNVADNSRKSGGQNIVKEEKKSLHDDIHYASL